MEGKGQILRNGYVYQEGTFKNGKLHGKGKRYFLNSDQIECEGDFKDGELDGEVVIYDKFGNHLYIGNLMSSYLYLIK